MAEGYVIHSRKMPKPHRFKYNMSWLLLNVDDISALAERHKIFSYNRLGMMSLYDKDYINNQAGPIKAKLLEFINKQSQKGFNGDVYLFTHPRFLGYGFNSVNFYFCYRDDKLQYIVSEINNTPWGEKHLYFHDCAKQSSGVKNKAENQYVFEFTKQFHISPFVPMDIHYRWEFTIGENKLFIKMFVDKNSVNILNVILDTNITRLMENEFKRLVFKMPFQPWKMSLGIYWQAFKLWLKKIPVHDHPAKKNNQ